MAEAFTPKTRSDDRSEETPRRAETTTDTERRSFLKLGALAGVGVSVAALERTAQAEPDPEWEPDRPDEVESEAGRFLSEATIPELQALMTAGQLSAARLVAFYLRRIRRIDRRAGLNSVVTLNPDARQIARELDRERRERGPRGPLHGIPIMLKDNIDTGDQQKTTAGSLALDGDPAPIDATSTARLRAAGAVILGKLNLSEWANFRGFDSSSGWCGVAGQGNNPYILDRNPCGSSSGTGAAVSANLCAAALGTETNGSIVCPASACGVVGIKPTVGLTSRAGVAPISDTQDSVGVHGRTVADAAAVLGALTGVDPRDPKTAASAGRFFSDYTRFLDPSGLTGARIGVARQFLPTTAETDEIFEQAVVALGAAGATVIDVEIPSFQQFATDPSQTTVLIFEFKRDLNRYLSTRTGVPATTVAEVIEFNRANAEAELRFFGQEFFELAEDEIFSESEYEAALEQGFRLAATEGIDATLAASSLDALVAPTGSPAWPNDIITGDAFQFGTSGFAAVAGYPLVTVPAGFAFGLPVGITFMGTAYSEPTLIRLASGFEAATRIRQAPQFLSTFSGGFRPNEQTHRGAQGALQLQRRSNRVRTAALPRNLIRGIPEPVLI